MLFKKCPRCEGDTYLEDGLDGIDIVCLQCGWRQYPSFNFAFTARRSQPASANPGERR